MSKEILLVPPLCVGIPLRTLCVLRLDEETQSVGNAVPTLRVGTRGDLFTQTSSANRRGVVLITVLICMIVLTLLIGSLLKMGFAQRAQARLDERRLQAEWLAESGLERAAARLAQVPDYTGETWSISAEELGGHDGGVVRILVRKVAGRPRQRRIHVQADFPRDAGRRARQSKDVVLQLQSQSGS